MPYLRLLRTVSHLRPRQAVYQILRRLRPCVSVAPATGISRRQGLRFAPPLPRCCGGEPWAFSFLNVRKEFDPSRMDWVSPEQDKLWRYNLHYFDFLHEPERTNGQALIESWITAVPQGMPDAWEPFPVSLRLVNWIKYFLAMGEVPALWLESLATQARWLRRNIEYHLLANHYFKNAKALVFAGVFFEGAEAGRWLELGLGMLGEELREQVLPDGGHFERSPMYHCMILEDCLDLWNLCRGCEVAGLDGLAADLEALLPRMLDFAKSMTHPDGEIALFNDAALGIEASPARLEEYFFRLGGTTAGVDRERLRIFPETGYVRMNPRPGDVLIVDGGPVGPDYQPGHAHCDTLSFELSLGGEQIIVDAGCSQYIDGEIRQYCRGNKGHNSLTVDGRNQSEVWGAHRVARRAKPFFLRADGSDAVLTFESGHDGYHLLPGRPTHMRRIAWAGNRIEVRDRVEGAGRHDLELRLHLHPRCTAAVSVDGRVKVRTEGVKLDISSLAGAVSLEQGWYCPEFGRRLVCQVVTVKTQAALPWEGGFVLTVE